MALTAKTISSILKNARRDLAATGKPYFDHLHENGLMLRVSIGADGEPSGLWLFRFQLSGKRRTMSIGRLAELTLAQASQMHEALRAKVKAGIDPLDERRQQEAEAKTQQVKAITFEEFATDYIAQHRHGWKNAKHAQQWQNTLKTYAFPTIGQKTLAEISTNDVEYLLKKIWHSKPETASRMQQRIERILDAATVKGLREGANPARWKGGLEELLGKKKGNKEHQPALPYDRLPDFWRILTAQSDQSSRMMQFAILTACRSGEARGATWREIDMDAKLWTIPASRMKAKADHRVPLSDAAIRLLQGLPHIVDCDLVFPSPRQKTLSDSAARQKIIQLDTDSIAAGGKGWRDDKGHLVTLHGFRSSFRDWCAEETHYPNIIAEMALAHTISNAVEAAYRRGDLLDKRRGLMQDWADFITGGPGKPAEKSKFTYRPANRQKYRE